MGAATGQKFGPRRSGSAASACPTPDGARSGLCKAVTTPRACRARLHPLPPASPLRRLPRQWRWRRAGSAGDALKAFHRGSGRTTVTLKSQSQSVTCQYSMKSKAELREGCTTGASWRAAPRSAGASASSASAASRAVYLVCLRRRAVRKAVRPSHLQSKAQGEEGGRTGRWVVGRRPGKQACGLCRQCLPARRGKQLLQAALQAGIPCAALYCRPYVSHGETPLTVCAPAIHGCSRRPAGPAGVQRPLACDG